MEHFVEWLTSLNWSALGTIVVTFLTTYAGTLIGLVIALIKTRANKTATQEEIQMAQTQTLNELKSLMADLEQKVIGAMNDSDKKKLAEMSAAVERRAKILQSIATASDEADKKLTEPSIDEMLEEASN